MHDGRNAWTFVQYEVTGTGPIAPGQQVVTRITALALGAGAIGAIPVSAVSLGNGALRLEVRQERKMQIAMLRKCFVAPHAIHRNPEQLGA